MIFFIYLLALALLIVLLTAILNSSLGPFLHKGPHPKSFPRVSLLVPARNEQDNIRTCLDSLTGQDYADYEILVLDDRSKDATAEIVSDYQNRDQRVRLLPGQPLPSGWTGKNWACAQLAEHATGELFIFTDADTWHDRRAVSFTVGWMQQQGLDFVSAFPQQITGTLAEKLVIPLIDLFIYGFLILWTTRLLPFAALAAANGQWIAMNAQAYRKIGGHGAVRGRIVEDVELSRRAKKLGLTTLTMAGTGAVYCRMYSSFTEVWQGFSKNFFGLTGNKPLIFLILFLMMFGSFVLPCLLILMVPGSALLQMMILMNLALRALLARRFKHPFWLSVLLHPVGILFGLMIGLNSLRHFKDGHVIWKGRRIATR